MSRTVSDVFKAAALAQETGEVVIALLTITHPDMSEAIRISNDPTQRLQDTPDLLYGTISRGEQYLFIPFQLTLPNEEDRTPPAARLIIDGVGKELIPLVRSVSTPAQAVIEIVLGSDLDTVEIQFPPLMIASAEYTAGSISLDLVMDYLSQEPYPAWSFDPSGFPGLFG